MRSTTQLILLGLAASSLAQFQTQGDEFETSQFQQSQQFQPQTQRFASQSQFQSQTPTQRVRRPQSNRFIDPDSVSINSPSNQGVQSPRARPPVRQQFVQPAARPRAPVRYQFDTEFSQQPALAPQEPFQQQPPQFQSFEPAPAPRPQAPVRTQPREQLLDPVIPAPARTTRPRVTPDPQEEEIARHQAENAKYQFQSAVTDSISDTQHVRKEERDGLALKGVYSYSDGYYKRTVHYQADENGYRIVKEDTEPIGEGPLEDPNGMAEVKSNVGGANLHYTITSADINPKHRQSQLQQPQQLQQSFLPQQ